MNPSLKRTRTTTATPAPTCIRRGTPDDAGWLSAFAAHTFTDTYGRDNRPEDLDLHLATCYTPERQSCELADPDVVTLLAHVGDTAAGYAQVRRGNAPACVTGAAPVELHRFYVDRPWHGTGVSQSLLQAARAAARELGAATLWLKVWEHNPRAIAFYSKAAFVQVGRADFFVGSDRQNDRVLALALDDASGCNPLAPPCWR
jgi:GNAT superfamily N-acetyltransferase